MLKFVLLVPIPSLMGRNRKVMLSVEQIMLHLPTAKFLHLPLKHLAKASERASEHQRQDLGIN